MNKALLLNLFFFYSTLGNTQDKSEITPSDTIIINVYLESLQKASIMSGFGIIDFSNPSREDTIIARKIFTAIPVHIQQFVAVFDSKTQSFNSFEKDFIFNPGDNIRLTRNKKANIPTLSRIGSNNDLTDINQIFNLHFNSLLNDLQPVMLNNSNIDSAEYYLDLIKAEFNKAEKRILNLYNSKAINEHERSSLSNFNLVLKYYRVSKLHFDESIPLGELRLHFGEVFDFLSNHLRLLERINSVYNHDILNSLVRYEAALDGRLNGSFWDYFDRVEPAIFKSESYQNFIFHRFQSATRIKRIIELKKVLQKIKSAGISDTRFDSLLSRKIAEEDLKSTMDVGAIVSTSGDTTSYYKIITSLSGKFIFVDFWASWCSPCRMQMPFLRKAKKNFDSQDIAFVSISVDKDESHRDWMISSKEEQLDNEEYNYRLLGGNDNELLKKLNLRFVPRYILYDRSGNVLDAHFITPEKKEFELKLKEILRK